MNENEENIAEETAAPVTAEQTEEGAADEVLEDKAVQSSEKAGSEGVNDAPVEEHDKKPEDEQETADDVQEAAGNEPEDEQETNGKEPEEAPGKEETSDSPDEPDDAEGAEEEKSSLLSRIKNGFAAAILVAATVFTAYVMINTGLGKPVNVFGHYVLRVMTGSMEPSLHTGDYIVVKKVDTKSIKKDDVITFYSEESDVKGKLVTHRVVDIAEDGTFQTMGDANPVADSKPVSQDQVIGKYVRKARFFRWVSSFADSKKLLLVLVIIPLTLVAFYEMKTVVKLGIKARVEDKENYEERRQELIREAIEKEKQRLAEEAANNSDKEISHEPRETNEKEND